MLFLEDKMKIAILVFVRRLVGTGCVVEPDLPKRMSICRYLQMGTQSTGHGFTPSDGSSQFCSKEGWMNAARMFKHAVQSHACGLCKPFCPR